MRYVNKYDGLWEERRALGDRADDFFEGVNTVHPRWETLQEWEGLDRMYTLLGGPARTALRADLRNCRRWRR